ncbi:hypothetical protein ACW95P_01740 [Candidatus Mycoplasma pogonae]
MKKNKTKKDFNNAASSLGKFTIRFSNINDALKVEAFLKETKINDLTPRSNNEILTSIIIAYLDAQKSNEVFTKMKPEMYRIYEKANFASSAYIRSDLKVMQKFFKDQLAIQNEILNLLLRIRLSKNATKEFEDFNPKAIDPKFVAPLPYFKNLIDKANHDGEEYYKELFGKAKSLTKTSREYVNSDVTATIENNNVNLADLEKQKAAMEMKKIKAKNND